MYHDHCYKTSIWWYTIAKHLKLHVRIIFKMVNLSQHEPENLLCNGITSLFQLVFGIREFPACLCNFLCSSKIRWCCIRLETQSCTYYSVKTKRLTSVSETRISIYRNFVCQVRMKFIILRKYYWQWYISNFKIMQKNRIAYCFVSTTKTVEVLMINLLFIILFRNQKLDWIGLS